MTDDLVERLRDVAGVIIGAQSQNLEEDYGLAREAADRIEKLEAALREIAESAWDCTGDTCDHCKPDNCSNRDIARKALEGKDD
jgi:N6-adenosine-specific RNA methylase IME4